MADIIGAFGVSLILLAYFMNLFNRLDAEHWMYLLLNLIGASMAFWSSILIHSKPFIVLEATWAIVSLIALIKKLKTAL
jgi:hypothetical protein